MVERSMTEPTISIAGHQIGGSAPCFIIAEIGINHGGDEGLCREMIEAAAKAGADAVKLQTVTPEESYHPSTDSYRLFRASTLTREAHERLIRRANELNVILFSTPGDPSALRMLLGLAIPVFKISSGLLTNLPLIQMVAASGKPLILSTGMAHLKEVADAVAIANRAGCRELALLQCTAIYPAPASSLNLLAMGDLASLGQYPVGYSDHHAGYLAAIAAVALGAKLIEKHFTLNTSLPDADHAISLNPCDFAEMVRAIRDVETMRGSSHKRPTDAELLLREDRHRRLVLAHDLESGATIAAEDLLLMRLPSDIEALPASSLSDVIGRRTNRALARLTGLSADMIEGLP